MDRLPPPATPGGMKLPQFGDVMGWGGNSAEAVARIPQLTREYLVRNGVTRQMAQEWARFYRNEMLRNPGNPSAPGRAQLMEAAAELLR